MLVLDANILIRAVLGIRVRKLLVQYSFSVQFVAPRSAYEEARYHLPRILAMRNVELLPALDILESIETIVRTVEEDEYAGFESSAKKRIGLRDVDDWHVLAVALAFNCAVWTEDADFFGTGVPTWTTDRVELFLAQAGR
jgi:predicted nucleic acid-binding protein